MFKERIDPFEEKNWILSKEGHLQRYKKALDFISSESIILDAGCGYGYGAFILSKKAKKVIAVDISTEALDYAKNRYKRKNIEYLLGDLETIDLSKFTFDFIICLEVIEHIKNPLLVLRKFRKWIKKKGFLLISTPNGKNQYATNPYHVRTYGEEEIIKILKKSGFKVNEVYGQYPLLGTIAFLLSKLSKKVKSKNQEIIKFSKNFINRIPLLPEAFSKLYKSKVARRTSGCLYFIAKPS